MKKYTMLFLVLALCAAMFTGCGCRNSQPMNTTVPTTMPTTAPTTMPTETTSSTVQTAPTVNETIEDGNGPLPTNATAGADGDTSSATEDTGLTGEARNRRGTQGGGTMGGGAQGGGTMGGGTNMR
jgi:hypothetical protein